MQAKLDLNLGSEKPCFCNIKSGIRESYVQVRFFYFAGTCLCNT